MGDLQGVIEAHRLRVADASIEEAAAGGSGAPVILVASDPGVGPGWLAAARLRVFARGRRWVVLEDSTGRPLALAPKTAAGLESAIGGALGLLELEDRARALGLGGVP